MLTLPLRLAATAACAVVLTACAAGGDTPGATREALATRVGVLVDAANREDFATARTALVALRGDVSTARRLGSLSSDRAAELLRLADGVEAALPAATRPTPTPTTAPKVAPTAPRPQAPQPTVPRTQAPEREGDADKNGDEGKGNGDKPDKDD